MVEYLRFENVIFCSSNCNLLRFSAHNLSLLLIYFYFFILKNVLTTANTTDIAITILQKKSLDIKSCVQYSVFRFFPLSSTLCLNLSIPNITHRGLIFGRGLYMEGVFRFKSSFLNTPGLIHGGAYYRNFTVTWLTKTGFLSALFRTVLLQLFGSCVDHGLICQYKCCSGGW